MTRPPTLRTACLLSLGAIAALSLLGWSPGSRTEGREATAKAVASQRSAAPSTPPDDRAQGTSGQGVAVDGAPNVTVTRRGELLGVRAYKAPLREVLESITRSSGVAFSGVDTDELVTADVGPLAVKELVAALLGNTSYGYLYVDAIASTSGPVPARVILVAKGRDRVAAGPTPPFGMAADRSAAPTAVDAVPNPEALREQRTVESLLDACKSQGCDSS